MLNSIANDRVDEYWGWLTDWNVIITSFVVERTPVAFFPQKIYDLPTLVVTKFMKIRTVSKLL